MLTLIIGCMYSGKTTEAIRRVRRARAAGLNVRIFKYANDTRYSRKALAVSHDGLSEEAQPIVDAHELDTMDLRDVDVVCFEEGQFIAHLDEVVDELIEKQGKHVIVTALQSNFRREPWGNIMALIPKAEEVVQLRAICASCKGDASFSKRIVPNSELELIGGPDSYKAMCRQCWDN